MNEKLRERYRARAEVLKALAHPTRLLFVEELRSGERCVGELQELAGADMSTVSKHLSVLRNCGIVGDEKRGARVYYFLRTPCVLNFFSCVEAVLEGKASPAEPVRCASCGEGDS